MSCLQTEVWSVSQTRWLLKSFFCLLNAFKESEWGSAIQTITFCSKLGVLCDRPVVLTTLHSSVADFSCRVTSCTVHKTMLLEPFGTWHTHNINNRNVSFWWNRMPSHGTGDIEDWWLPASRFNYKTLRPWSTQRSSQHPGKTAMQSVGSLGKLSRRSLHSSPEQFQPSWEVNASFSFLFFSSTKEMWSRDSIF